jgi:hypothetical protein
MNYSLYQVRIVRDVPMLIWVSTMFAINIIEAEDLFQGMMISGDNYLILQKQ